jgi:hypothetical protein
MSSSVVLSLVTVVRTDISEERISSIVRVTSIGKLVTKLAVTINRWTLKHMSVFLRSLLRLIVTANVVPRSPTLVTSMMETIRSSDMSVLTGTTGITSQKTALSKTGPVFRKKFRSSPPFHGERRAQIFYMYMPLIIVFSLRVCRYTISNPYSCFTTLTVVRRCGDTCFWAVLSDTFTLSIFKLSQIP